MHWVDLTLLNYFSAAQQFWLHIRLILFLPLVHHMQPPHIKLRRCLSNAAWVYWRFQRAVLLCVASCLIWRHDGLLGYFAQNKLKTGIIFNRQLPLSCVWTDATFENYSITSSHLMLRHLQMHLIYLGPYQTRCNRQTFEQVTQALTGDWKF